MHEGSSWVHFLALLKRMHVEAPVLSEDSRSSRT